MDAKTRLVPERTLSIYIHSRGFSYAVMDSPLELIETRLWETSQVMDAIESIINQHQPITLIIENCNSRYCRKGKRAQSLIHQVQEYARQNAIPCYDFSRDEVRAVFQPWKATNKHEIAEVLISNIEPLQDYAYEKPSYPNKEKNCAAIFAAVSLCVTHYFLKG